MGWTGEEGQGAGGSQVQVCARLGAPTASTPSVNTFWAGIKGLPWFLGVQEPRRAFGLGAWAGCEREGMREGGWGMRSRGLLPFCPRAHDSLTFGRGGRRRRDVPERCV